MNADPTIEEPAREIPPPTSDAGRDAGGSSPSGDDRKSDRPRRRGILGALIWLLTYPAWAWQTLVREKRMGTPGLFVFVVAVGLWAYVLSILPVMWLCHTFPKHSPRSQYSAAAESIEGRPDGVAYCDAILYLYESGIKDNWMVNDRLAPTVFLDNPQNFQLGMLEGLRYGVRILRDNLSRQRSTDAIDPDVEKAFAKLNIDARAWVFPMAEAEYAEAMDAIRSYRKRLIDGEAKFHPRADNLAEFLFQMNSLTGGANTRLLNCVPDSRARISEETAGDPNLAGEKVVRTKVPWSKVDDAFFYARGVAFAYRELLLAVNHDFRVILEQRNADEFARSIVVDFLDDTVAISPVYVANGRYGSMWANHPYQLLGLLSQVRERSRSLRSMVVIDDK